MVVGPATGPVYASDLAAARLRAAGVERLVEPVDSRATAKSALSALLTAAESRKALATSGSSTMTFAPSRSKRLKYLPRSPVEKSKSYSRRRSSSGTAVLRFIASSLTRGRLPRTDDSNDIIALRVGNDYDPVAGRVAERDKSSLSERMIRVGERGRKRIVEHGHCFLEGYAVLLDISSGFIAVPFKLHSAIVQAEGNGNTKVFVCVPQ